MSDVAVRRLQKRYYGRFGNYINWPFTRKIRLGDIGKWSSGKTFSLEENLSNYGVELESQRGASINAITFDSTSGSDLNFKAAGKIPVTSTALVEAKAGVSLALNANCARILRANNLKEESVSNMRALEQALIRLGKDAAWWRHRTVITAILRAGTATVALAHSSKQRVDIYANAATAVPFDLADADLDLEVGFQSGDTSVVLLAKDIVLAFQRSKLKKDRWWHSWDEAHIFL